MRTMVGRSGHDINYLNVRFGLVRVRFGFGSVLVRVRLGSGSVRFGSGSGSVRVRFGSGSGSVRFGFGSVRFWFGLEINSVWSWLQLRLCSHCSQYEGNIRFTRLYVYQIRSTYHPTFVLIR